MKTTLLAFALLAATFTFSQPLRVEPANWWIGMKKSELQLLVYGKDIAATTPEFSFPGVTLDRVIRVQNSNYLFLDLTIDQKLAKSGTFDIIFKRNNKAVQKFSYSLLDRKAGSAERASFTPADIIYQVVPDRFANGDSSNDKIAALKEGVNRNTEDGRHGGDLKGVIDHLDYIADLGFSAIWMTPVLQNDQPNYSYHGYSITDFYQVDARMGTNDQYRQLSEAAAGKGMKIIKDMVFNHCGSEHWWMKDLPSSDWLNFSSDVKYTNHRKTVILDPHVAKSDSILMVDGWFAKTMPDLNQKNPLMATYLIQNSIWWVEFASLGGIRVDTYPYPDMYFMGNWTKRMLEEYPHLNIVGEEWSDNPATVSYWQRGKKNQNGYVSYLSSLMDFPVQSALIKALNTEEKYDEGGFLYLYDMLANDFQYADADNLVVFADNHDIHRVFNLLNKDPKMLKILLSFVLTSRGIPQILYGTELMMEGTRHGTIRSDFPGGWNNDASNGFTGQGLQPAQADMQRFVKTLVKWRNNHPVLSNGKLMHFRPLKDAYVYLRYNEKGKVLVILNKGKEALTLDPAAYGAEPGQEGLEVISGRKISLQGSLTIPAGSSYIIDIRNQP